MSPRLRAPAYLALPIAVFLLSTIFFLHYSSRYFLCRLGKGDSWVQEEFPSVPPVSVGFDLTAFYGTVAVSYPNGSTIAIARVEASSAYRETVEKLSLPSSQHPASEISTFYSREKHALTEPSSPPYQSIGDGFADEPRQKRRRVRKAMGLPASRDVGAISSLIKGLRQKAEEHLGSKIATAIVATPQLVALYEEDIYDAFEYVGMRPIWQNLVKETSVAYAGYGFGLCTNFTNPPACKDEQRAMPQETVMAVLYTKQALTVSLSEIKSAYWLWEPEYRFLEDFTLGHDALEGYPEEADYWENVRNALVQIMVERQYYPRPRKVLVMGDKANDGIFRRVLDEALRSMIKEFPEIFEADAEYVAAKGAAEFAKRAHYVSRMLTKGLDDAEYSVATEKAELADWAADFRFKSEGGDGVVRHVVESNDLKDL